MGKKRDLANEHIELLIDELVDTRESNNRGYCCHSDERNKCIHDCETCKEKYFENMISCKDILKKTISSVFYILHKI